MSGPDVDGVEPGTSGDGPHTGVPVDKTDVGSRLRDVRRAQRRTLREVAEAAQISESFLSQVERARVSASVATLRRIAGVLGVTIADLFQDHPVRQPIVLRAENRPTLTFGVLGRKYHLHTAPERTFDSLIGEFEPGGTTGDEPYTHGSSEEFMLVLDGAVTLELGGETMNLGPDDSIVYSSAIMHRLVADPVLGARVLWVTSPPSY